MLSTHSDERCDLCGHFMVYHTVDACYGHLETWCMVPCGCPGYPKPTIKDLEAIASVDHAFRSQKELLS